MPRRKRLAYYPDASGPSRIKFNGWRAFEVVAVLTGLVATFLAWQANELARQALRDQQISAAWQILSNHQPGSTGKQYALGVLLNADDRLLTNLDLGCERAPPPITDNINPEKPAPTECVEGVDLSRMSIGTNVGGRRNWEIAESDLSGVRLDGAIVRGGVLRSVDLSEASMTRALFIDVDFAFMSLAGARLSGAKFDGSSMTIVDLSHSELTAADFSKTTFRSTVNISGASLCQPHAFLDCADPDVTLGWAPELTATERLASQRNLLSNAWYWDDDPPVGVASGFLELATRCAASERFNREKRMFATCRSQPEVGEGYSMVP